MPFLVTLADLRPLVRSQAGVQRVRYIDDTDLNPWIVGAWVRLYDMFANSGDPYLEKEGDIIVGDAATAPVPSDLYALRRVNRVASDGSSSGELRDLDVHEVLTDQQSTSIMVGYRLRGQEVQVPFASSGDTIRLVYVPAPKEPRDASGLYLDTQKFDVFDVKGREWIVLKAAIRALQKQREDASQLEASAAELRMMIEKKATRRTTSSLRRVADVASGDWEDPFLVSGVSRRMR